MAIGAGRGEGKGEAFRAAGLRWGAVERKAVGEMVEIKGTT